MLLRPVKPRFHARVVPRTHRVAVEQYLKAPKGLLGRPHCRSRSRPGQGPPRPKLRRRVVYLTLEARTKGAAI